MRQINRCAMTMIEVLCATALASLLMVAVLGVVGGLARHEKTLAQEQVRPEWNRRLEARLAGDLAKAHEVVGLKDGLRITGPLAHEAGTGVSAWRDAVVEYRLRKTRLGWLLLRSERDPQSLGGSAGVEVICAGPSRLVLTEPGDEVDLNQSSQPAVVRLPRGRTPSQLRLRLLTATGDPVLDTLLTR